MNPFGEQAGAGDLGLGLGGGRITKVSIGICVTTAIISFLGYLPRTHPFFVLSLSSFTLPFPKPWVLVTSTFYCSGIFSGVLFGLLTLLVGRIVEPSVGLKEFLRLFLMIGLYTNILVVLFALTVYLAIGEPDATPLIKRPFETHSAASSAIIMTVAHLLLPVEVPTPCCVCKMRLIPFISFCLSLVFTLISKPDDLVATTFGTVLSFVYIRWIKKNRNTRGDPAFDVVKLLPACGCDEPQVKEPDDDGRDDDLPEGMLAPGMPGVTMPPGMAEERHNFRLDQDQRPQQRPPQGQAPPQGRSPFQGRPRTIGP
jgi:membrane associated rhomboid family serine protease